MTTLDVAIPAYNAAPTLAEMLASLRAQTIPAEHAVRVYVTDDGSSDDTAAIVESHDDGRTHLVRHPRNRGRSAARNSAAAAGTGEFITFVDADCPAATPQVLARILAAHDAGADAVFGTIVSDTPGFWGRYTNFSARRRLQRARASEPWALTSNIFSVRRTLFDEIGGFDEDYLGYGFEDRDLFIRICAATDQVTVDDAVVVKHQEGNSVAIVCRKQYESGVYSSGLFLAAHPDQYRASNYYQCDVRRHGRGWSRLGPLLGPLRGGAELSAHLAIETLPCPFPLRQIVIRVASCLAYFHGTCSAVAGEKRDQPGQA